MEQLFLEMMKFDAGDSHRIQHFTKVHSFARLIGLGEKLDDETLNILEISAIVHDIGIKPSMKKYGSSTGNLQELEGPPAAEKMLQRLGYPKNVIDRVCYLVGHHHTYKDIDGMDYQILVEADFLVNMHEKGTGLEAVKSTMDTIFQTRTGKEFCQIMFNV